MKREPMPLNIKLQKSKVLLVFVVIIHVLAILSCLIAAILLPVKLMLIAGVSLHFIYTLFSIANLKYPVIRYSASKAWEIEEGGAFNPIQVMPSTVLTPLVIFLHFKKQSGEKQSMLIVYDAISSYDFRKLTLELRIASLH